MANDTMITDDYVAELLAKEANGFSLTSTKPANKAKPNTRFLRHIIKETTNHNAALLAKEAAESQARLNDLQEAEEDKKRKIKSAANEQRRRQLGDITAILSGRKRRHDGEEGSRSNPEDNSSRRHKERRVHERGSHRSKEYAQSADEDRDQRSRRDDDRRSSHRRDRSRSPDHRRRKHRDRSPLGKKSDPLGKELENRIRYGRLGRESHEDTSSRDKRSRAADADEDSDPLDEFIGPAPPPRARGRGAAGGASAMDSRFSSDYDPKADTYPELGDGDDWEEALEAHRDRQKLKQQGAGRLRAAGFTEEQVRKWQTGGEKTADDVRWSRPGEGREWDKGKVVDADGTTKSKAQW